MTTRDISEINVAGDGFDTRIHIKYTPEVAARLRDATTAHDGLSLALWTTRSGSLSPGGFYGIGPDGTLLRGIRSGLAKLNGNESSQLLREIIFRRFRPDRGQAKASS